MCACGCKKNKTSEPVKVPNTVKITEGQNKAPLTKEQIELIEKLKKINGK